MIKIYPNIVYDKVSPLVLTALPSGINGFASKTFWSKEKGDFKLFVLLLWLFSEQFL